MDRKKKFFGLCCLMTMAGLVSAVAVPARGQEAMRLTSPAFEHNQLIPPRYTCRGEDVSPPLTIVGIPEGTKTLALIVDDPDAPVGTWVHWVVFNIPPTATIPTGQVPGDQGYNDFKRLNYGGPCPPSGIHRYFFKLYALDTRITYVTGMNKGDLEKAMEGHVLAQAQLIGLYPAESSAVSRP